MSPEEEVIRAGEARQILDMPIFKAARANLETQMAAARRAAPIKDADMHTRLILLEQLTANFFEYFEQIAVTGKMAEITLRQAEERRSFLDHGLALFKARGRNI
jgi:hypothetical protein